MLGFKRCDTPRTMQPFSLSSAPKTWARTSGTCSLIAGVGREIAGAGRVEGEAG